MYCIVKVSLQLIYRNAIQSPTCQSECESLDHPPLHPVGNPGDTDISQGAMTMVFRPRGSSDM